MALAKIWKRNGKNWDDFRQKKANLNYTMMQIRKMTRIKNIEHSIELISIQKYQTYTWLKKVYPND